MKTLGFTVVELLVTLSIMAILLAIAPPSFNAFIKGSNMVSNSNGMVSAFNYARMEAIKRGNSVQLGQRDGSSWTGGLVVWVDADGDGSFDSGEELRLWEAYNSGSSVVSTNSLTGFEFNASGEVNLADRLRLCDDRTGEEGWDISILISGAIFAEKVTCA